MSFRQVSWHDFAIDRSKIQLFPSWCSILNGLIVLLHSIRCDLESMWESFLSYRREIAFLNEFVSNATTQLPEYPVVDLEKTHSHSYCEKWNTRGNEVKLIDTSVPFTYQFVGKHQMELFVFSFIIIVKQKKAKKKRKRSEAPSTISSRMFQSLFDFFPNKTFVRIVIIRLRIDELSNVFLRFAKIRQWIGHSAMTAV